MALSLEAHELHFTPHPLECSKELLRLLYAAAQILLAMNNQERRGYIFDVRQR